MYIGQTKFISNRIHVHRLDKGFDRFLIRKINGKNNFLEAYLIFNLMPKYNKNIPTNRRFLLANFNQYERNSMSQAVL